MKVVGVTTRAVRLSLDKPIMSALGELGTFGCILVSVRCDNGVVGENLVFTLHDRRTKVLRQMIDELAELVIGRDAGLIADFWSRAWTNINFIGHTGIPVMAISAIDGALWDALGKSKQTPLYRLLGGARTSIPAYHSGGLWLSHSDRELIEEAQGFVASGFKAVKMRLGSGDAHEDARRVGVVRNAIGPKIALMADANQALTPARGDPPWSPDRGTRSHLVRGAAAGLRSRRLCRRGGRPRHADRQRRDRVHSVWISPHDRAEVG